MTVPVTLALTAGEPAGIGPELCLQMALQTRSQQVVVVASQALLEARSSLLGFQVALHPWQPGERVRTGARELSVLDVPGIADTAVGRLDPGNSRYVLETLTIAAQGCLAGIFDGMVTAPVHKGVINE